MWAALFSCWSNTLLVTSNRRFCFGNPSHWANTGPCSTDCQRGNALPKRQRLTKRQRVDKESAD